MIRLVIVILCYIYVAPIWFYKIWRYGRSEKYTEKQRYSLVKHVAQKVSKAARVDLKVYGKENIPDENGFILFSNHQGHYDAIAFLVTMEKPFSIVIKKESGQIFFLNQVIDCLKGLRMDHADIRQSMRVIMQMAKEVSQGRNYLIFPEGLRTETNGTVGFKPGSFKSAVKAKAPIVPAVLINSHKVFEIQSLKKRSVQLHYLPPLYYDDYKDMKTTEISNIVETRISKIIREYQT